MMTTRPMITGRNCRALLRLLFPPPERRAAAAPAVPLVIVVGRRLPLRLWVGRRSLSRSLPVPAAVAAAGCGSLEEPLLRAGAEEELLRFCRLPCSSQSGAVRSPVGAVKVVVKIPVAAGIVPVGIAVAVRVTPVIVVTPAVVAAVVSVIVIPVIVRPLEREEELRREPFREDRLL